MLHTSTPPAENALPPLGTAELVPEAHQTRLAAVVAEAFEDASFWDAPMRNHPDFGLMYAKDEWDQFMPGVYADGPSKWIANVYGMRVVPNPKSEGVNAIKLEAAKIEDIPKIHAVLNETVLAGENMHVATPVVQPHPEEGTDNTDNNDLWLGMIHDGQWPIMQSHMALPDSTVEVEWYSHDYADFHLGNFALFPREVQDAMSEAAGHELTWRKRYRDEDDIEARTPIMLLPGERTHDKEPFANNFRGGEGRENGINKIDHLSDVPNYLHVLAFVVDDPERSCQERLDTLSDPNFGDDRSAEKHYIRKGMMDVQKTLADITNFNTRHREKRNATQEEVDQAFADFNVGLVRIAEKIRGAGEKGTAPVERVGASALRGSQEELAA